MQTIILRHLGQARMVQGALVAAKTFPDRSVPARPAHKGDTPVAVAQQMFDSLAGAIVILYLHQV